MTEHASVHGRAHTHGPNCGHATIEHRDHRDYIHRGFLEHVSDGKVEAHTLDVTKENPATCTPAHSCGAHAVDHVHGPNCGHTEVPHGDHADYVVDGHLHHPCANHCDDHGPVDVHA